MAPRTYKTKAAREEAAGLPGAGGVGGPSSQRGAKSTRGKRKRAAVNELDARTIVATNPFDDEPQPQQPPQHQLHNQPPIHPHHHHHHHQQQQQHHHHLNPHQLPSHIQQQPPLAPPPLHIPQQQQHFHGQVQTMPPQQQAPMQPMAPGVMQPYGMAQPPPQMDLQQQHTHQQIPHHAHPAPQMMGGPPQHQHLGAPQPPPPLHLQPLSTPPRHMGSEGPLLQPMIGLSPTPPSNTHPMYGFQSYSVATPPPSLSAGPQQQVPQLPQPKPAGGMQMHQMDGPPQGPRPQPMYQGPPPVQQAQRHIYCAECHNPITEYQTQITCRAGCEALYHQECSGLTPLACQMLLNEPNAEWACNRCICSERRIPVVKMAPQTDCRQPVWLQ